MSGPINPCIGSGIQKFHRDNVGKFLGPTTPVAVINFEDATAVNDFANQAVSIPTSAAVRIPSTNLPFRRTLILYNQGAGTVFMGGTSGVTTANGYPIVPLTEKAFEIGALLDVWAIASGIDSELRILELA